MSEGGTEHARVELAESEGDLLRRVQAGDRAALDQLIDDNLAVVVKIAGRFRHRGLSDRDLIAEGTLGLIRAARHIVMLPELRFIEVAVWWIQRAIQTAIIEQVSPTEFLRPCGLRLEALTWAEGRCRYPFLSVECFIGT